MLAETAGNLIANYDVSKATIREVARAAGVSTGTVSHYYSNSHELMYAAYKNAFDSARRRFVEVLHQDDSFDGLINAIFTGLPLDEDVASEWRVRLAFWGVSKYDDEVRRFEHESSKQFREVVAKQLQRLAKAKAVVLVSTASKAAHLIETLMVGTAIQVMMLQSAERAGVTRSQIKEQIIQGVLQQ